ncbi:MAG: XTP/dITP diphosphatase [Deltaproteobacteria bacterium]|nr:XTP/dITP diphosphatase [Deltaproteobacteria bacterium]
MIPKTDLVIATRNQGKLDEIRKALSDLPWVNHPFKIHSLDEFPEIGEIEEDGKTFEENALKKARTVCQATRFLTLGDDSGLVVPYLNGSPGVFSARYSGPQATASQNNEKLLKELDGVPTEKRIASYVCVMVLVSPTGKEQLAKASCQGVISETPKGSGGFGYDPLFFLPSLKKTMAEIPLELKNRLSHRGKALEEIKKKISYAV